METESSSDDPMELVPNSLLLGLPMEIFQLVIRHMDEATFFTSLLTCKHFLNAARSSRANLLQHMHSLATAKVGLDDLSTHELLLVYRIRAAATACAAGVLADVRRYVPTPGVKIVISAFSPPSKSFHYAAQLAVVHECGTITIYQLRKRCIRRKLELFIQPQDENNTPLTIMKMTFSATTRDLAVLYKQQDYEPPFMNNGDPATVPNTIFRLVTFRRLRYSQKGNFYDSDRQETRDLIHNSQVRPIGLALASNGTACVSFAYPSHRAGTTVYLYERNERLMEACSYDQFPHFERVSKPPCLPSQEIKSCSIFDVEFVDYDKKLNLHLAGNPIHSWYTLSCDPIWGEDPLAANVEFINLGDSANAELDEVMVGMPFHGRHACTSPNCRMSYLALGTTKADDSSSKPVNGFIMQAAKVIPDLSCGHGNCLAAGRYLCTGLWRAVAVLAGWRQGTSSLGTVVAISPDGSRIAAATWTQVLIWTLNPQLLHSDTYSLQEYFPTGDFHAGKGLGRLKPTQLPCDAVVHRMLWTNERHLFAITDRGLMKWDIGHMSKGMRVELPLA